jgi:ABC-type multidrug transport system fused ATPase/permease subunit
MRRFLFLYGRVLGLLAPEKRLAITLAAADCVLGLVALAGPLLFGRVVDALTIGAAAFPFLVAWAVLGFGDLAAQAFVALHADRLAHRRRWAAMVRYFENAMALPLVFHAEKHSGRLLRAMLTGADSLFGL